MPWEGTGRNWNDAAERRGLPKTYSYHPKLERGREGFYPQSLREGGPAGTLILDL